MLLKAWVSDFFKGFNQTLSKPYLTMGLGFLLLIVVSVSLTIGFSEPNYRPLYSDLNSRQVSDIASTLKTHGIDFRLGRQTGSVLVAVDDISEARIRLAQEGLPQTKPQGLESFSKESGFGLSQFMESAKYKHAIASDLAQTISRFQHIKVARVHLALPKQSAFAKDKERASASVFVDVEAGQALNRAQVSGIVNLVATAVPKLDKQGISVVNQKGMLLTEDDGEAGGFGLMAWEHKTKLENYYTKKINSLITPLVGRDKLKTTVNVSYVKSSAGQPIEKIKIVPVQNNPAVTRAPKQR